MQAPPGSSILYHDPARLSFSFLFFTSIILLFCFLPFISIFPFVFSIKKKFHRLPNDILSAGHYEENAFSRVSYTEEMENYSRG